MTFYCWASQCGLKGSRTRARSKLTELSHTICSKVAISSSPPAPAAAAADTATEQPEKCVAAIAEGDEESADPAPASRRRIGPQSEPAEIDLGHLVRVAALRPAPSLRPAADGSSSTSAPSARQPAT
jgi:hypothetical protein